MTAMVDNLAPFLEKSADPTQMKSTEIRDKDHWARLIVGNAGLNLESFAKTATKWINYLVGSLLGLRLEI